MMLSDRSLAWLRHLDRAADDAAAEVDPLWSALSVGLLARRTPAWTEPYRRILDRLIERQLHRDRGPGSAALLVILGLRAALGDEGDGPPIDSDPEHLAERLGHDDGCSVLGSALAGLGLRLHDTVNGTDLHDRAFTPWWARVRPQVLDPDHGEHDDPATLLDLACLLAPQAPDDARRVFEVASDRSAPSVLAGRAGQLAALLVREWGLEEPIADLTATAEASWPPGSDAGSLDALLATAETTGPGRWSGLFNDPLVAYPQVVGVDFPEVALHRAEWIGGSLHVGQSPVEEHPRRWTTYRLVGGEPRMWYLTGIDGATMDTAGSAVVVRVPQVRGELEFAPGSY